MAGGRRRLDTGQHGYAGYRRGCRCESCQQAWRCYQASLHHGPFDPTPVPERRIAARVADLFADRDAARMRELDALIAAPCRFCGGPVSELSSQVHPGACGRTPCRRAYEREQRGRKAG